MAIYNWQYGNDVAVANVQSGQLMEVYPGKVLQIWQISDNSVNLPIILRTLVLSDSSRISFDDIDNDTVKILTDNIYTP